jgi:hypothetical protein
MRGTVAGRAGKDQQLKTVNAEFFHRNQLTTKVKVTMTEAALHRQVAKFLDAALCPEVFWTTIDHAGGGKVLGAQRKARGARKGIPDVLLVHQSKAFWIELKTAKGRVSEAQKEVGGHLVIAGCPVTVARSLEEVQSAVLKWDLPLRGRIA